MRRFVLVLAVLAAACVSSPRIPLPVTAQPLSIRNGDMAMSSRASALVAVPPELPFQVQCLITGAAKYTNGDDKWTVRCPVSRLLKGDTAMMGAIVADSPLVYPLTELSMSREAAARLTQAIKAAREIVAIGWSFSVPVSMTALQREEISRVSMAILGDGPTAGIFDAAISMLRNDAATAAEVWSITDPVQQWAERWREAMRAVGHDALHQFGTILKTVLEPVRR